MFLSLDYIYIPTSDVPGAARQYAEALGARLVWQVRGMGTMVACLRVTEEGPAVLLSGHLLGDVPVLVYRVRDYRAALEALTAAGVENVKELEIPHGPCASFRLPGGQRYAIYELVRPGAATYFDGRFDD